MSEPLQPVQLLSSLDEARERVRRAMLDASASARAAGLPAIDARGQLIRPLVAYASAARLLDEGAPELWSGVLAIQLAHEASLVHDDVVDESPVRRGEPTVVARYGVAAALVQGDHLLTAAYRLAAATGSLGFATLFARAVERTVAGEIAQGKALGRAMDLDEYREIALGKAGELLGCSLALAPVLAGRSDAPAFFELGRRLGLLYQMVDDLLDYCPSAGTGKAALGDLAQRRWTWPLTELGDDPFSRGADEVLAALRASNPRTGAPLARCLGRLRYDARRLREDIERLLPGDGILAALVADWMARAASAIDRELSDAPEPPAPPRGAEASPSLRERVPDPPDAVAFLAANSRSFRFAARLLPAAQLERVAGVYAFCRVTDDLVDLPTRDPRGPDALLGEWLELARGSYQGRASGLRLLDRTMAEMAAAGVPFDYAADLAAGMRMDLRGERYETLAQLRLYTYRVASVVGLWLTRLSGVHDPGVLADAARLGHAMQLTNILRDVGEDLRAGRLYLPAEMLRRHGVDERELRAMLDGSARIGAGYRALLEELMAMADADYERAFRAIPALPPFLRRPVAVAARVYQGIHAAIRRNGYDNLRVRAHTSGAAKGALAARALVELYAACSRTGRPTFALRLRRLTAPFLVALAAAGGLAGEAHAQGGDRLEGVRALYLAAVEDGRAVDRGYAEVARVRAAAPAPAALGATLAAYEGALETLRAKHAAWPPNKLRHLRAGFATLDSVVAAHPVHVEARYLRLMSGYYLPSVFGRSRVVREDFAALARLLPSARADYPAELYRVVGRFVLEKGKLSAPERAPLEATLEPGDE